MPEIKANRIATQKVAASPFVMKHPTKNPINAITAIITTAQIAFIEIAPFINSSVKFILIYLTVRIIGISLALKLRYHATT